MTEYYNLPVRFTEEEREKYAAWGIKKQKVETPFGILFLLLNVAAIFGTFVILVGIFGDVRSANLFIDSGFGLGSLIFNFVLIILFMLIYKPLDMLCDKIMKRPEDPRMLRMEPCVAGMKYKLLQKKDVLCSGILSWDEWDRAVCPQTNQIWIEGECLRIGANTVKTIYPKGKQHIWMDHPAEKIVGTIQLEKIQRIMKGYLASLEEQKREEEWRAHNECNLQA